MATHYIVSSLLLIILVHNSLATVAFQSIVSHGCQRDQLHRCVKTAEPLLRNPDYVVPATLSDVSTHCRIGTEFIDCIRDYAMICLTSDRRQQQLQIALDEAVKNDEMCSNANYQADYLKHAPCIKSMATDEGKCRKQLSYLIDQVSALSISNIQICCAHHAFQECMLAAADRNCRASLDGKAVQFTKDMFSKSLAFLLKQCEDYVPNSAQCPIAGLTAQDVWETSVPLQDSTRPTFNDFTTRRSNNFVWQQTTFKPWYPGIRSNSIDSPKQQGLFSKTSKSTGNVFLFLSILFIPLLF
ncbi:uncharacterized protein LOC124203915 [Daphnia pulex]|uniref:uncharacterized protein LOC124203915 n=1 Tax=Daphnia pulex TaxID=6669 RepID=UPI001EDD5BC3|nr:uncharacterized protein LOC124203915 [Daphnia pulex]